MTIRRPEPRPFRMLRESGRHIVFVFKQWILLASGLLFAVQSQGQETVFGQLIDHVEDLVTALPGASGNQYDDPTAEEAQTFSDVLSLIRAGDLAAAHNLAMTLEYLVVRLIDHTLPTNQEFIILERQPNGTHHWGTLIYNPDACRKIAIQCPHPRFDTNTGLEGAYIFTRLSARVMMLSGTHRCNSTSPSSCSGTTSACGATASYRISDIAHNDLSMFQEITETLAISEPELIVIQLHGFARQSGDPHLIMSNGTRDTPDPDPIAALRGHLQDIDPTLECEIVHMNPAWTRLTGFTNTQGRYLNESPDVCSENASKSSGLFMHLEQEFNKFRADEDGWNLMYQGLSEAFLCSSTRTTDETPPGYQLSGRQISFDLPAHTSHFIEIYTSDGRCLQRTRALSDTWYPLPRNMMLVIILREANSGQPVFRQLFFFTD